MNTSAIILKRFLINAFFLCLAMICGSLLTPPDRAKADEIKSIFYVFYTPACNATDANGKEVKIGGVKPCDFLMGIIKVKYPAIMNVVSPSILTVNGQRFNILGSGIKTYSQLEGEMDDSIGALNQIINIDDMRRDNFFLNNLLNTLERNKWKLNLRFVATYCVYDQLLVACFPYDPS